MMGPNQLSNQTPALPTMEWVPAPRIMLGEEDIPTSERRNKIMKGNTYIDKVMQTSIYNVNNDKNR